jgi:hypothetical protein
MEVIAKTNIQREKGYLYFLKSDEEGKLLICKAIMQRGGKKKNVQKDN